MPPKPAIAVVAVATNLVGALVEPSHEITEWPRALLESNLSGEIYAEVVAVYVSDLHEGGAVTLLCRATMTGQLAEIYATACKVRRSAPTG